MFSVKPVTELEKMLYQQAKDASTKQNQSYFAAVDGKDMTKDPDLIEDNFVCFMPYTFALMIYYLFFFFVV